jgi:multidrug transporter EmrE-like cation transporter
MNDFFRFAIGILFGVLAQIITFFQLQGSTKFEWIKNNYFLMVLLGMPISMLFMYSVKNLVIAFNGQLWPSRLIGFSIGAIVFTILSWTVFNEPLTLKTYICLFLALAILLIQLFLK